MSKSAQEIGEAFGAVLIPAIVIASIGAAHPVVTLCISMTCIGAFISYRLYARHSWNKEQAARELAAQTRAQDEAYRKIIYWFKSNLGYINRALMDKDELQDFIESETPPEELCSELIERLKHLPALRLGSQFLSELELPVKLTQDFRDRHLYIIGKSGSGKTTLIRNLVAYDLEQGSGIGIIAPEQEMLTDEVLPFIPEDRIDDVIYFNPADGAAPVGFNPFYREENEDVDTKVDEILTILTRIIGEGQGARMEQILRQTLHALVEAPDTTMLDIERFLDREDDTFRRRILEKIKDEETRYFFEKQYPAFPKDAHFPITTRLGKLLRAKPIRNVLGVEKGINFRWAMDSGKIMLFNLSDGILGEQASQMVGQLVVSKIQIAAMSRANIPQDERRRFYLYIDEFQTFTGTSSGAYEKILSRARKYRLSLILAHQQTGQIPPSLLKEITGNVSTLVGFRVDSADASKLSKEFVNVDHMGKVTNIESEQFLSLQIGQAYCRINQNSFFLQTHMVKDKPDFERSKKILERSREQWGTVPLQKASPDASESSGLRRNGLDDLEDDF